MTTTQIPDSIRASIHQDAINRVSEFFNATTMDIMNELLQNSRRSGATAVEITTGDDLITVADNGHGIKDPAALLAFGLTEWDQDQALAEHPAGMGLYSLARCETIRISSKTQGGVPWQVDLTPEHFVGKLDAPVNAIREDPDDPGDQRPQGTTVTFSFKEKGPDHTGWRHLPHHAENILEAARHYPLPILLNGEEVPRKDFLAGAGYTEEWEGIRIGVYPTGNHSRRVNYPGRMNFHGIVIQNPGLHSVETMGQPWSVNADVLNCPRLSLTLPARREVVETPFMEELRQACMAAVYRAMQAHPEPVRVPFEVSAHAAALGIALPEAAPELKKWMPETANHNWSMWEEEAHGLPDQEDSIIMDLALDPPDGQALARAAGQNGLTNTVLQAG